MLCQLHTHVSVVLSVVLYALHARVAETETIEHMHDGICMTRTSTIITVPRYTAEYYTEALQMLSYPTLLY